MLRSVSYVLVVVVLVLSELASAQPGLVQPAPAASANGVARQEEKVDTGSPRASIAEFLADCAIGDFAGAAEFLDLLPHEAPRGPTLARMLKAVLDRHLTLDLEAISADPLGNRADMLAAGAEEIGKIPVGAGKLEPVRLVRRQREDGSVRWIFSRATVLRIEPWYAAMPNRWMIDHLPEPLLRPGPRGVLRWQWMALPLLLVVALLLGAGISKVAVRLLRFITAKTAATWDDAIAARLGGPLTLATTVGIAFAALPLLALYSAADRFVSGVLKAAVFVALFWSLLRSVDVVSDLVRLSPWGVHHAASRSLVPLGARIAKVALAMLAVVAVISELGYPVASLIAGLGIGGLAVALASQKTVENLFGAFSIGVDQPFREGDFVKIEDFMGTVETVGLRSTRVRTLDRTLVSLPNGKLAEMRIESFAARDRIRLLCILGLIYGTTAAQMRLVLAGIEQTLRQHPKIAPDGLAVTLKELAASSLDVEVIAYFLTTDYGEFQKIRQEMLLQFMEVVEKAGTAFAFPSRTVHLVQRQPSNVP